MSRRIPNDSVDAYTTTDQQASPAAGPLKHEASTTFNSFGFRKGNVSKATRGDYSMTILWRHGTWPLRTTKRGLQVPLWYGGMASGRERIRAASSDCFVKEIETKLSEYLYLRCGDYDQG
ncbi:uncharacterized protein N7458_000410 [Penicillium daleae]|uniref:Uncharacterized protein n=1 Tax=Penicillium daleae TaxID=63821 RepID=A0AAD6CIT9_9EURO|nr:uncharacterized protein N7458_000410 [Penicillium daleae]KAJ5464724.1 hypothetical protein N7458_000410 [Penicillium daleae]